MKQVGFLSFVCLSNSTLPVLQHFLHVAFGLLQSSNVHCDPSEFLLCEFKHSLARSTTSITSHQDFSEFCQSEADLECPLDSSDSSDCTLWIEPVARLVSHSFRQDADSLVVSNRVGTDSRHRRQFAGVKSRMGSLHYDEYQPSNAFQCQGLLPQLWLRLPNAIIR